MMPLTYFFASCYSLSLGDIESNLEVSHSKNLSFLVLVKIEPSNNVSYLFQTHLVRTSTSVNLLEKTATLTGNWY